ncbi:ketopantoate reductase family protein [Oscillospiraceae bacterium LTW-04]|nr:ketopantoate reductase family protein [Oscillospiraceae bacterium MB24-C1]
MKIKKVTLIGLGAMGVFFAPKLEAGLGKGNFRVLADGARKDRLETDGVTINGVTHHFTIITPETTDDPADLVIMAVKDTGLTKAISDIKNQIGAHTQVICVMNGVDSEERVAEVYGWDHVLYSYMRVSINMRDGVANFDPKMGKVHFGEAKNAEVSDRVRQISALFDACGVNYQIDEDMVKGLWFKFMCNVGENLTCALLDVPFGAYRVSEHANEIRRESMWEVVRIANKLGIGLGQADVDNQEAHVRKIPFYNKPSTLLDIEAARKTEVEMFAGKVITLGKKLGVKTPLNWMFYHAISVREEKNAGLFEDESF